MNQLGRRGSYKTSRGGLNTIYTKNALNHVPLNVWLDESRFVAGCITGMGSYV